MDLVMFLYVAIPALHKKLFLDIKLFIHYYYMTRQNHTVNILLVVGLPKNSFLKIYLYLF